MSMRISERGRRRVFGLVSGAAAALGLSALAVACSGDGSGASASGPDAAASATPGATASGPTGTTVSCALNGAVTYANTCTLERVSVGGVPTLVIRHPNGAFRRFEVVAGPSLAEADGAQRAVVLRSGSLIEVTLGADRYRLDVSQLNVS